MTTTTTQHVATWQLLTDLAAERHRVADALAAGGQHAPATAVRELAQETQRRADDAIRQAARELEDLTR